MEDGSVVVSCLFGGEKIKFWKVGRLPWHQFGALPLWTDLAGVRNPFLCFLGSLGLRGSF